ncbi:MAG: DUF6677 family protein [Acidobacteriota bacterium]
MKTQAEPQSPSPTVSAKTVAACVAAWLVPGSGHLILGRVPRAAIFFVLILLCAFVGVQLEGKLFVPQENAPLSRLGTLGSMGMGVPYFVLRYAIEYEGNLKSASYEYGSAFLLTAGLMNLMVILDVWDIGRGTKD